MVSRAKAKEAKQKADLRRWICHMLSQGARVTCYPPARVSHVTLLLHPKRALILKRCSTGFATLCSSGESMQTH